MIFKDFSCGRNQKFILFISALPDITRLTKLEVLNLAFSDKVENQGMLEICQMTHLKKLDVCWLRNITGEAFEKVSKLTKLIHLDISNVAGVAVGYLTALLTLTNLELLDTSYYKLLTDFGLSIIGKLTKMTRLVFVDHRMVTSDGFNFLTDLRHLNHLSLSAMPNIANDHFYSALTNLTYLSVKMTSERNFSVLGHLTKMKDIHIHTTDVDLGFFLFCSAMPDLARINLRAARCSIEVDMLTHCTDLTSLELEDCASYYGTDSNSKYSILINSDRYKPLKSSPYPGSRSGSASLGTNFYFITVHRPPKLST